jgi:hypothetical protein
MLLLLFNFGELIKFVLLWSKSFFFFLLNLMRSFVENFVGFEWFGLKFESLKILKE